MPSSYYRPKPPPFLTDIMVSATLPELNRRANNIANAAKQMAMAMMEPEDAGRYASSVGIVGTATISMGGGPRAGVLVGPQVAPQFARAVEAKHAIMARAAGAA